MKRDVRCDVKGCNQKLFKTLDKDYGFCLLHGERYIGPKELVNEA